VIHETVDPSAPIRQGDIFHPVPYAVVSLDEFRVASPTGTRRRTWDDVSYGAVEALLHIEPTWAIVASQDCDASNRPEVSLFRIDAFNAVTGLEPPESADRKAKWWSETATVKSRLSARWFYLPEEPSLGFTRRMAVDFCKVLHLDRQELESRRASLRRGRLRRVAYEHFRECIAHFFRRYPYDEWYPLTKDEFEYYRGNHPGAQPFDWQQ
jgi:hypothetical protein